MVATDIKKIMHYLNCLTGVYSKEIVNTFFVSQMSGLVENVNTEIYSDTKNVINVKLCMVLIFIKLYLFIRLSVILIIFQGHSNVEQF